MNLHLTHFENMYSFSHPSLVSSRWVVLFLDVINKAYPPQKEAGKTPNPLTMAEH